MSDDYDQDIDDYDQDIRSSLGGPLQLDPFRIVLLV